MKSFSEQVERANFADFLEGLKGKDLDIIIIFSSKEIIKQDKINIKIREFLPNTEVIGCSTAGEMGEFVDEETISVIGMQFDNTKVKCISLEVLDSKENGAEISKNLLEDDLAGVFLLLPGFNVNGSKFVLGLRDVLPENVSISGGMAGDGTNFGDTITIYNDEIYDNRTVAFGLYGDDVEIKNSSRGGWRPFGPLRRVTKSIDNILYEIDDEPALDLYKRYLGEKTADLPSSALLYPFAVMDEQDLDRPGLIRTILDINEEDKSLIFAGDLLVGQHVCLMHSNTSDLVEGANAAAGDLMENHSDGDDSAVICVSCVGRKILMGDDTEDELDAVKERFGESQALAGFYSYGEISHFNETDKVELHNQTMTITRISEKAG